MRHTPDRRAVLRRVTAIVAAAVGAPAATATLGRQPSGDVSLPDDSRADTLPVGSYGATVDRVVDGEHVVILCERDGVAVAQLVVPRERLPEVEEGARLAVSVADGQLTIYSSSSRFESLSNRR